MNILNRNLLQQITLKSEFISCVYRMQRLQIHRSHDKNGPFNLVKTTYTCTNRCRQIEYNTNRYFATEIVKSKIEKPKKVSLMSKIKNYFKSSKAAIKGKSNLVYAMGIDSVNHMEFVEKFQMPNTFNSWFLITEIHVWMLMVRAMAELEIGQEIRNEISGALWYDVLTRTKGMGSASIVKKQIVVLSQQFQYAIVAYDEGLTTDDKQLASALWTRFFESNCDNYENIELLIKYIRYNISKLDQLNSDDFLTKRKINWASLREIESGKI